MKDWWVYDTEGDGLVDTITKFHCLLFKRYKQNEWCLFLDFEHEEFDHAKEFAESKGVNLQIKDLKEFKNWIREPSVGALICQNQFGFDLPAFKKLFNMDYDMFPEHLDGVPIKFYDTLSMSRCLYPDRPLPDGCPVKVKNPKGGKAKTIGPHGLEAWGYKVANKKVAIEDWEGLPLWKYVDRVWEDVIINTLQLDALIEESQQGKELGITWKTALRRNALADFLMYQQEEQGVVFNEEKAWALLDIIDEFMVNIEEDVEPKLPMKVLSPSNQPSFPANPFTGSGEISSHGWNYLAKYLGYDVNFEALAFKAPPKTAFKGDGEVSKAGEKYCINNGVEDPTMFADFIRGQRKIDSELVPLPEDQLELALIDLRNKKTVTLREPMRLGNQQDIKRWLVEVGGWKPTLWRLNDVTKNDRKQIRTDEEIKEKIFDYIEKTKVSPYRYFIYKQLSCNFERTKDNETIYKKLKRRARNLPTSPQFKDQRGNLCPNLERLEGALAKQIVKWLSARNRRSVIKAIDEKKETGWLNHPRLKVDGKLPARFSGLTNTNRRKHTICANVPKPKDSVLFGKNMRELWTVPEGYMQIGIDASNMENIIAAWWAWIYGKDNGEYYEIVSVGDPHTTNANAYSEQAGRTVTRDEGKGITYAVLYGAGAQKVADMLGISKEAGQGVIDAFWDSNLGLKRTKEYLENFWERSGKKFIRGIDGRKIWTRSKSALLNCALQSTGAIMMDLAGILLHQKLKERGYLEKGVARTIYYHDEYQLQVPLDLIKFKWFNNKTTAEGYRDGFNCFPTSEMNPQQTMNGFHKDIAKGIRKKMEKDGKSAEEIKETTMKTLKEHAEGFIVGYKQNLDKGITVSANVKEKDGKYCVGYCKVGEIVIESIEEATQMLQSPVKITGEYMLAWHTEGWKGAH